MERNNAAAPAAGMTRFNLDARYETRTAAVAAIIEPVANHVTGDDQAPVETFRLGWVADQILDRYDNGWGLSATIIDAMLQQSSSCRNRNHPDTDQIGLCAGCLRDGIEQLIDESVPLRTDEFRVPGIIEWLNPIMSPAGSKWWSGAEVESALESGFVHAGQVWAAQWADRGEDVWDGWIVPMASDEKAAAKAYLVTAVPTSVVTPATT